MLVSELLHTRGIFIAQVKTMFSEGKLPLLKPSVFYQTFEKFHNKVVNNLVFMNLSHEYCPQTCQSVYQPKLLDRMYDQQLRNMHNYTEREFYEKDSRYILDKYTRNITECSTFYEKFLLPKTGQEYNLALHLIPKHLSVYVMNGLTTKFIKLYNSDDNVSKVMSDLRSFWLKETLPHIRIEVYSNK